MKTQRNLLTSIVSALIAFSVGCGGADSSNGDDVAVVAEEVRIKPSGTISINEPAPYVHGQTIHYSWSVQGTSQQYDLARPMIETRCTQGGAEVMISSAWYASGVRTDVTLSSMAWTSGAATCTAKLIALDIEALAQRGQYRKLELASVTFDVQ
jgi:hypothetical protein